MVLPEAVVDWWARKARRMGVLNFMVRCTSWWLCLLGSIRLRLDLATLAGESQLEWIGNGASFDDLDLVESVDTIYKLLLSDVGIRVVWNNDHKVGQNGVLCTI
mmetsp:Transcript_24259/g.49717  ORF Transcript_24259/g.49717 Transcript_24259/m.49717 type:complete len:104 (+) Transcript_24259:767-1078(+)